MGQQRNGVHPKVPAREPVRPLCPISPGVDQPEASQVAHKCGLPLGWLASLATLEVTGAAPMKTSIWLTQDEGPWEKAGLLQLTPFSHGPHLPGAY